MLNEEPEPGEDVYRRLARVGRGLSKDYAPDWNIPPSLQWYGLPERVIAEYLQSRLETLQACRAIEQGKLAAIEDGTYYQRGDFGTHIGLESFYNSRGGNATKFALDRAEVYHRLWWIDVCVNIHTRGRA
jgi:hypothetical protein